MNISGKRSQSDSPCVGICSATSLGDPICRGCGRTAQQVMDWYKLAPDQRAEINRKLESRSA